MSMRKISSKDAAALLKQAATAIRTLEGANAKLQEKIASAAKDAQVVRLAREMEEKGLMPDFDLAEKVAHLRKAPNLEVTAEAVKLAAPQSSRMFSNVGDIPGQSDTHPFETFIVTGEDSRD